MLQSPFSQPLILDIFCPTFLFPSTFFSHFSFIISIQKLPLIWLFLLYHIKYLSVLLRSFLARPHLISCFSFKIFFFPHAAPCTWQEQRFACKQLQSLPFSPFLRCVVFCAYHENHDFFSCWDYILWGLNIMLIVFLNVIFLPYIPCLYGFLFLWGFILCSPCSI